MTNDFDAPNNMPSPRPPELHGERRRSPRWSAHIPVFIYGHTGSGDPFHEEAYSSVVNDDGALLVMTVAVAVGERLLLINRITQIEQECLVVRIGHRVGPNINVAVELTAHAEHFWRITPGPQRLALADPSRSLRKMP